MNTNEPNPTPRKQVLNLLTDVMKSDVPVCDKPKCVLCRTKEMYDKAAAESDVPRMTELSIGSQAVAALDSISDALICYKELAFDKAVALADAVGNKREVRKLNLLRTTWKALKDLEAEEELEGTHGLG